MKRKWVEQYQAEWLVWYSRQARLNTFKEISETVGPYILYCIGANIPKSSILTASES